jgi:predicted membrane channel-forming protein YqfA (hemolysin III family)
VDDAQARHRPTPAEARARLDLLEPAPMGSGVDRWAHAGFLIIAGAVLGVLAVTRDVFDDGAHAVISAVLLAGMIGALAVVDRVTRTVPRRARRRSWIALTVSLAVGLVIVTPWLNLSARTAPNSVVAMLGGGALVALPCVVAAIVVVADRS